MKSLQAYPENLEDICLSISSMETVLFEHLGIRLTKHDQLSPAFIDQIKKTVLGRQGYLRYQHGLGLKKARHLSAASYLELSWRSRLIGVIALAIQEVKIGGKTKNVLYVRYFSIQGLLSNEQGQEATKKSNKSSKIKQLIIDVFNDPDQMKILDVPIAGMYAYVEEENIPSFRNVQMTGFQRVGAFTTTVYSRINPNKKISIERLDIAQINTITKLLEAYYTDHDLVPDWQALMAYPDRLYYVHKKDEEILAGMSVVVNEWNILEMPGMLGWLNRKVLSKIPWLKKVFFDKKLPFLEIEMIYHREDMEFLIPRMIETLMEQNQQHHALVWSAPDGKLHQALQKGSRQGLLHHLNKPTTAGVYFKSFDPNVAISNPVYVSADGIS